MPYFDKDINKKLIKEIKEVFKDDFLRSYTDKINLGKIFRGISLNKDIKVL